MSHDTTQRGNRRQQTFFVTKGLPDTHRLARGILIAANHSEFGECGCLEPSAATLCAIDDFLAAPAT